MTGGSALRQTDQLAAYRIYESVIAESSGHQLADTQFKERLSAAGDAKNALYTIVGPIQIGA